MKLSHHDTQKSERDWRKNVDRRSEEIAQRLYGNIEVHGNYVCALDIPQKHSEI